MLPENSMLTDSIKIGPWPRTDLIPSNSVLLKTLRILALSFQVKSLMHNIWKTLRYVTTPVISSSLYHPHTYTVDTCNHELKSLHFHTIKKLISHHAPGYIQEIIFN